MLGGAECFQQGKYARTLIGDMLPVYLDQPASEATPMSDLRLSLTREGWVQPDVGRLPPERGGRIPAIALTAHSLVQDRLQSLRAGFQSHVPKPVVPEELVEVVASIIHLRRT